MLIIQDNEYFEKVCQHAEKHNMGEELWRVLYRMHVKWDRAEEPLPNIRYYQPGQRAIPESWAQACRGEYHTTIYRDFAPASFLFNVVRVSDNMRVEHGGMIFQGNQAGWERSDGRTIEPGEAESTFTVSLTPSNGWTINT